MADRGQGHPQLGLEGRGAAEDGGVLDRLVKALERAGDRDDGEGKCYDRVGDDEAQKRAVETELQREGVDVAARNDARPDARFTAVPSARSLRL